MKKLQRKIDSIHFTAPRPLAVASGNAIAYSGSGIYQNSFTGRKRVGGKLTLV